MAIMTRSVLVLALAYLFLALASLQLASGQEGGVAEAEIIDVDEVLDALVEAGVAEVSWRVFPYTPAYAQKDGCPWRGGDSGRRQCFSASLLYRLAAVVVS